LQEKKEEKYTLIEGDCVMINGCDGHIICILSFYSVLFSFIFY